MEKSFLLTLVLFAAINCFNKPILITVQDIMQSTSSTQCKVLCEEASQQMELFCAKEIDSNLFLTKYCVDEQVDQEFLCKEICQEKKVDKRNAELEKQYPLKQCSEKNTKCISDCNNESKDCLKNCEKQNKLCKELEEKLKQKSLWRKYFDEREKVEQHEKQEQLKHGQQLYKKTEL